VFIKLKKCNCCEKTQFFKILKIANQSISTANNSSKQTLFKRKNFINLTLFFCVNCKNIQLREAVNPKILYKNFNYETSFTLGLTNHFSNLAKTLIKKFKVTKEDKILDIGSNDGSFLMEFKKKNIQILGVDPSKKAFKLANNKGIETLNDYFNYSLSCKIKKKYNKFKIITSFNTFANIYQFDNFLLGVSNLLLDEGVFIIETQYGLDVIEKNLIDTIYHEHINYFSLSSLKELFERNNLKIYDFERLPNKGGSIRVFCKKNNYDDKFKTERLNKGFLNENKKLRLNKILKFKIKLENIKKILKNNLKVIKKKGYSISAFGSSVGSTTLINYFQLHNDIDFIYDDNPLTDKLFFSKSNIQVKKSDQIKINQYIIILAWRYSENIMKKHKNKKVNFINFLPKYKIN
jgi:2-polyprenyl-3-methyl-5-hydroxy-6-metoxy-1,4-benzoquinol methylase